LLGLSPLLVRYFSARSGSVPGYGDGEGLNLELPPRSVRFQSASVCGVAENRSQHCLRRNHAILADTVYLVGRNLSHLRLTPREGPIDLDKVREMTHPDDREMVFRNAEHAADVVLILPARVDSRGQRIILG